MFFSRGSPIGVRLLNSRDKISSAVIYRIEIVLCYLMDRLNINFFQSIYVAIDFVLNHYYVPEHRRRWRPKRELGMI